MRFVGAVGFGLLLLAVAEVVVFVLIAQQIGAAWALGIALALSVLGGWLVQREGARGWRRFRDAVGERRPPGAEAADGFVGLTGALLLAIPGFLSGAAGLLLLFPPVRAVARAGLRRTTERRIPATTAGDLFGPRRVRREPTPGDRVAPGDPPAPTATQPAPSDEVIEGEIIDPRS